MIQIAIYAMYCVSICIHKCPRFAAGFICHLKSRIFLHITLTKHLNDFNVDCFRYKKSCKNKRDLGN